MTVGYHMYHSNYFSLIRFFLAFMVFYHHSLYFSQDDIIRFGASAVIAFYFISGFLNIQAYNRIARKSNRTATVFLVDRFIRMAGVHYVTVIILIAAIYSLTHRDFSIIQLLSNILIVPLAFYPLDSSLHGYTGLSWTIGTEYCFYVMLVGVYLLRDSHRLVLFYMTLIFYWVLFFIGAFFHFSLPDIFTKSTFLMVMSYTFPFFTFWIFYCGVLYFQKSDHYKTALKISFFSIFVILFFDVIIRGWNAIGFSFPLIAGFIFILAIVWVGNRDIHGRYAWLANYLGELTYPLYIGHGAARVLASTLRYNIRELDGLIVMWGLTIVLTLFLHRIDLLTNTFRYKMRDRLVAHIGHASQPAKA